MAKILVLAKSGFGKTTSYCGRGKLGIKGLDPKETYVIQCIGRGVPNPNFKLIEGNIGVENVGKPTQKLVNANAKMENVIKWIPSEPTFALIAACTYGIPSNFSGMPVTPESNKIKAVVVQIISVSINTERT